MLPLPKCNIGDHSDWNDPKGGTSYTTIRRNKSNK